MLPSHGRNEVGPGITIPTRATPTKTLTTRTTLTTTSTTTSTTTTTTTTTTTAAATTTSYTTTPTTTRFHDLIPFDRQTCMSICTISLWCYSGTYNLKLDY